MADLKQRRSEGGGEVAGISSESLHHPAPWKGRQGQPAKMFFFRQPKLYPLPGILIRSRFRFEDGALIFSQWEAMSAYPHSQYSMHCSMKT